LGGERRGRGGLKGSIAQRFRQVSLFWFFGRAARGWGSLFKSPQDSPHCHRVNMVKHWQTWYGIEGLLLNLGKHLKSVWNLS